MAYGVSNNHVTDDVTWPPKVLEAVPSAIPATAWLLVDIDSFRRSAGSCVSTQILPGGKFF